MCHVERTWPMHLHTLFSSLILALIQLSITISSHLQGTELCAEIAIYSPALSVFLFPFEACVEQLQKEIDVVTSNHDSCLLGMIH